MVARPLDYRLKARNTGLLNSTLPLNCHRRKPPPLTDGYDLRSLLLHAASFVVSLSSVTFSIRFWRLPCVTQPEYSLLNDKFSISWSTNSQQQNRNGIALKRFPRVT